MFNLKRLAKYTLASGLALGLVLGAGSVRTMAADPIKGEITENSYVMDYNHNVLRINVFTDSNVASGDRKTDFFAGGEPKYVYVGIGKTEAAIKVYDRFEVKCKEVEDTDSNTYTYNYYVEVDLPTYVSPSIEYVVKAYSSNQTVSDAKLFKIAKQTKKLEVKYAPKTATLTVKADGTELEAKKIIGESPNTKTISQYEIKTLYGDWVDAQYVTPDKYNSYAVYGATLVVREKATDKKPASKEVKVKIPKMANGPKATINPTKLTVTIPNNALWRIIGNTPRSDVKANANNKYIWTATDVDNDGWIKNSVKTPQALTELQKKITEADATIKGPKVNPDYNPAITTPGAGNTGFGKYLKDDGDGTDDPAQAEQVDVDIALLKEGAVLELKTEATDKKAESKVSFFEIPVQSEAVEIGTDFEVTYGLNKTKLAVAKMDVKNTSSNTLEVALVDSSYDITKVTFAKLTAGSTKSYAASAAKEGKILLVRTASVAANAKQNVAMALGGEAAPYTVAYPKKADSLAVTLTKVDNADAAGKATLKVTTPDENKKYAYKIDSEDATDETLGLELPSGTTNIDAASDKTVTAALTGLAADKYVTVYEYDATTKVVSKMVSHKILASEISAAPAP